MKTLGHPGLILTPEKPELKSRHPPKNKGFEEPDLPRDKSNYEPNPIGQYPYAPQPITQRRRMHLEAYVGVVLLV